MNEDKKELAVVALAESESQAGSYCLVLEETTTKVRIPMIIGHFEAQAIAMAMERMVPARPLTHDLFKNTLLALGAQLEEVFIHQLVEGIFYAQLGLRQASGELIWVDARSSDAIALAVRFEVPIYTVAAVLAAVGFGAELFSPHPKKGSLAEYSLAELEVLLERVLAKEDFESAARIRDLITRRRNQLGGTGEDTGAVS